MSKKALEITNNQKDKQSLIKNSYWILKLSYVSEPFLVIASTVASIWNNSGALVRAFVLGLVIDWSIQYVNSPDNDLLILKSLSLFAVFFLFSGLMSVVRNYSANLIGLKLGRELPSRLLYEKLSRLDTAALEDSKVQNLINLYGQNDYLFRESTRKVHTLIGVTGAMLLAITPLFTQLPLVTMLAVLASIPALFVNRRELKKLWDLDKETLVSSRVAWGTVGMLSSPATLKEIRLLNAYQFIKSFFEEYMGKFHEEKSKIFKRWSNFDVLNTLLSCAVILVGLYQLIQLAALGEITIGGLTFLVGALTSISWTIDSFTANYADFAAENERITEVRKLLEWPEDDESMKKPIEKLIVPPTIDLQNISFKYPNASRYVIKNLNLKINPGEKIAIVGENGAGKTTLVKLISSIYPVTKGKILIDGEDLNNIKSASWYRNLGVLFQDFNKYEDLTAAQNIAIGRIDEEIKDEALIGSAKKADAYDFIMKFDDQFEQVLSERYEGGTRPSTGQWQKIAIARFFYRNAPILILDEPTAAIDAVAEANIFNRIYEFINGKTVIIISHRFSTVRNADRIIVFDKGEIVEEGSHDELMKLGGKYAHAFELQSKGYR
ncbi:MAG: ABC transporter ATP-binding protein [Candidatus Dojkabacteria bacterium]|nr:MAG: ABC transporter ATP-binding protein [Candidatus Dojkabacteria bacterium]